MTDNISVKDGTAILITDAINRKYFSSLDIEEGIVVLCDCLIYFVDARYFSAVKSKIEKKGFIPLLYKDIESVKKVLIEKGIHSLGLDYTTTTLKQYADYKRLEVNLFDATLAIKKARAKKEKKELQCIKKACEITQKAFYSTLGQIKEGITELEVKEILVKKYKEFGASGESFDTIVAFGKNSAVPHHKSGKTKLKKDSVVLIDTGCKYKGYCSDYTRTMYFGTPSTKFVKAYELVKKANEVGIENAVYGAEYKKADTAVREVFKKEGVEEYFTHSLGHGLGMEIHEYPTISSRYSGKFSESEVFTIEPGLYFDGRFGIRIEDTVVIQNKKAKRLFTDDKRLIII